MRGRGQVRRPGPTSRRSRGRSLDAALGGRGLLGRGGRLHRDDRPRPLRGARSATSRSPTSPAGRGARRRLFPGGALRARHRRPVLARDPPARRRQGQGVPHEREVRRGVGRLPRARRQVPRGDGRRHRPAVARAQRDPRPISSVCAVLAESEIINHVSEGVAVENILRGIHNSLADRALSLLKRVGLDGPVAFIGGVALAGGHGGGAPGQARRAGPRARRSLSSTAALGAAVLGLQRLQRLAPRRQPTDGIDGAMTRAREP